MNKTISLCMIVKNEEKYIQRCLESIKDKVDQIIIVDTGSTDSTIEIVRRYTSDVYDYEWKNDFSDARNYSIQFANSDYILVLDADEYVDSDADLQADIESEQDYYLLNIHNVLSYGGAFKHIAVRLFANHKGLYYQNRLHEHLNILDEKHDFTGGSASTVIHHTGYTTEIMEEKGKVKRNLPLMLKEVEENPDAYNLYNMGKTYMSADEYEKAIKYFQRAYPLSSNRVFLPELITKLSYCLSELDRNEDALTILKDAINLFPMDTEMRYMQGKIFAQAGYNKDAEITFQKCLEMGDHGAMLTEGSGGYMARFSLAELYESQNRISESYDQIVNVLQIKKSYAPALMKYFELVSKANISAEEVYQNINMIYNVSNINELQMLLDVLYSTRHPLLNRYLAMYKSITVQSHIKATAAQYAKEYELAKSNWLKVPEKDINHSDVILLAAILRDEELYDFAAPILNLNNKEAKTLKSIVLNESINKIVLTTSIEKLLLTIITQLIALQEFDLFEKITNVLLSESSLETKCEVGYILLSYGFTEVAIDLLAKSFEEQPNNIKLLRLIGDTCLKAGYLEDAQLFYSKLLDVNSEYSSYERCYDLYEKSQDVQGMRVIKEEIRKYFPLANWTKGFNAL
ncbi:glycosyltransferase [Paenibacillus sp. NPDC058177]|uniref:glycosyltransferase n=1 Tax=Paenibacillus sp. NPDC058177 TaxID=3346369 RepID=UPI0036D83B1E